MNLSYILTNFLCCWIQQILKFLLMRHCCFLKDTHRLRLLKKSQYILHDHGRRCRPGLSCSETKHNVPKCMQTSCNDLTHEEIYVTCNNPIDKSGNSSGPSMVNPLSMNSIFKWVDTTCEKVVVPLCWKYRCRLRCLRWELSQVSATTRLEANASRTQHLGVQVVSTVQLGDYSEGYYVHRYKSIV